MGDAILLLTANSKPLVHGHALCAELIDFLKKNKKNFEDKLIPCLSHIDHMAQNINGIEIEQVTYVGADQYQLDYSYDWEVYRGCSDMNEADIEYDSTLFTVDENGYIEIDFLEPNERNTCDEF
ncbi:hypothetical protein D3C80_665270 [compost metagenome]